MVDILPLEILLVIFSYIEKQYIFKIKYLSKTTLDNYDYIWKNKTMNNIGYTYGIEKNETYEEYYMGFVKNGQCLKFTNYLLDAIEKKSQLILYNSVDYKMCPDKVLNYVTQIILNSHNSSNYVNMPFFNTCSKIYIYDIDSENDHIFTFNFIITPCYFYETLENNHKFCDNLLFEDNDNLRYNIYLSDTKHEGYTSYHTLRHQCLKNEIGTKYLSLCK